MKLTEVFINDNKPPHEYIVKGGYGTYAEESGKFDIEGAAEIRMPPEEKQKYFVGSRQKNFPDAECTAVLDQFGPFFFKERGR